MIISITGSRSFTDYDNFKHQLEEFCLHNNIEIEKIISGGAKGVDALALRYAEEKKIPIQEILPDWEKHGRGAGIIRNKIIIDAAEYNIVFWDGKSKGSKSNIDYCTKNDKKLRVINV